MRKALRLMPLVAAALLILPFPAAASSLKGPYEVRRVFDGDTIELHDGAHVRLLGIDTPELHHKELPVQRFAQEAADYLAKAVQGHKVTLELLPGNERDPYGRTLAYVYAGDIMLNELMLRNGYAYAYGKQDHPRFNAFMALETEARRAGRGMWNFALRDGRMAGIIGRYERLNPEGRQRFDAALDELVARYPVEPQAKPASVGVAATVMPWHEADSHIGEAITVEGTIIASHNSGKACFLNFDKNYKRTLTLVIFADRFPSFPPHPERHFLNRKIRVTGTVTRHGGRAELILSSPSQITLAD